MRRLMPWLLLAGCSSQGSLEIRVTAPPELPITEVELYVGIHDRHDESIRPAAGPTAPSVWWKRDDNPRLDVEPLGDDGALFAFQPGGSQDGVAALVAVGFGPDPATGEVKPQAVATQLVWTDIPHDEIHRYRLELAPADALPRRAGDPATAAGVQVWGPRGGNPRQCVQVDNIPELMLPEYGGAKAGLIVSADDQDCDGLIKTDGPANVECFENLYMAQAAFKRDALTCAHQRVYDLGGAVLGCVAGGATCADGTGMDPAVCSPSAYCLPSKMCSNNCTGAGGCDPYGVRPTGTMYIQCPLFAQGTATAASFCDDSPAKLALDQLFSSGSPLNCDMSLEAKLRSDASTPWNNGLDLGATVVGIGPAPAGNCTFALKAGGAVPMDANGPVDIDAMLSVPFGMGTGLMIPLVIEVSIEVSCPPPTITECILLPTDTPDPALDACMRAPAIPGTEVVD